MITGPATPGGPGGPWPPPTFLQSKKIEKKVFTDNYSLNKIYLFSTCATLRSMKYSLVVSPLYVLYCMYFNKSTYEGDASGVYRQFTMRTYVTPRSMIYLLGVSLV